MADSKRDNNSVTTLMAVSNADGITPVVLWADPVTHRLLTSTSGGGSVTSVSVTTANGVSGSVATATTTPAITLTLGAITPSSVNGLTITSTTGTFTLAAAKVLTVSNTLTFTGTDSSSVAFGTGGTVAYVANKLSVFAATTSAELAGVISDETGSGALVFANTPTLVTPVLGVASATSLTTSGKVGIGAALDSIATLYVKGSYASDTGTFLLESADPGSVGVVMDFYHNSASPAIADLLGIWRVWGRNAATTKVQYANIQVVSTDVTTASAYMAFYTSNAGTMAEVMRLQSDGNVAIGTTSTTRRLFIVRPAVTGSYSDTGFAITDNIASTMRLEQSTTMNRWSSNTGWAMTANFDSQDMLTLDINGNFAIGKLAALATNATNGFVYIPTSAGAPTGAPTAFTGKVAMQYDTTNNKICVYNGAWKTIVLV